MQFLLKLNLGLLHGHPGVIVTVGELESLEQG